jgi:hypothetical protein
VAIPILIEPVEPRRQRAAALVEIAGIAHQRLVAGGQRATFRPRPASARPWAPRNSSRVCRWPRRAPRGGRLAPPAISHHAKRRNSRPFYEGPKRVNIRRLDNRRRNSRGFRCYAFGPAGSRNGLAARAQGCLPSHFPRFVG